MLSPWHNILLVLIILSGVMGGVKQVSTRCRLHPETSRKAVHISMGLVTLSFPWLFSDTWPVLLLTVLAIAALTCTRLITPLRKSYGAVLNSVERLSLGEIYFPLAVAALFLLSAGNHLLYVIPLLTLTLADAVAALVGVRYGQHRFCTSEGTKSAEGSLAFFMVAFLSAHVPLLLLSDTGRAESLLIALVLGILVMLFEAVSVGGLDNLFIPLGCYALLRIYQTMTVGELLFRLGAILLLALLVFVWRRRTTLKESGLLAAALVGYMNWALGGWQWLTVSLALFLTYTLLWPRSKDNDCAVHTVRAVASTAAPGMFWLVTTVHSGSSFFVPFTIVYAAHSVMIGVTQLGYSRPEQESGQRLLQAVVRSWLLFMPFFFLPVAAAWNMNGWIDANNVYLGLLSAIIALPLLTAAGLLHQWFVLRYGVGDGGYYQWLRRGVVATAVSLAAGLF